MQSIGSDALFKSNSPSVRLTGEGLDPTASRHVAAESTVYRIGGSPTPSTPAGSNVYRPKFSTIRNDPSGVEYSEPTQ